MGRVVALVAYRQRARKDYRDRHRMAIETFVRWFVDRSCPIGFADLTRRYHEELVRSSEMTWDYENWRDMLRDAFERAFGGDLRRDLAEQRWYRPALLPLGDVIDLCLAAYINGSDDPDSPRRLVV